MTEQKLAKLNEAIHCLERGEGTGLTRRQIANCLNIKVTPYLINLLQLLVDEGFATKDMDYAVYPPVWRYYPTFKRTEN